MPVRQPAPGDLEPIETASRDEIAALQLQRLRQTLRHAYDNVPHYRQAFDARGVHPDDLKTLADLAKFPFTTKKDLRDNYPFGLFAVPRTAGWIAHWQEQLTDPDQRIIRPKQLYTGHERRAYTPLGRR